MLKEVKHSQSSSNAFYSIQLQVPFIPAINWKHLCRIDSRVHTLPTYIVMNVKADISVRNLALQRRFFAYASQINLIDTGCEW